MLFGLEPDDVATLVMAGEPCCWWQDFFRQLLARPAGGRDRSDQRACARAERSPIYRRGSTLAYTAGMIQAAVLSILLDEASVQQHSRRDRCASKATCVQVVRHYLDRIDAYDDRGPALNAIITVNPRAIETAAQMDRLDRAARAEPAAALHPGRPERQLSHRRHADHRRLGHVRENCRRRTMGSS